MQNNIEGRPAIDAARTDAAHAFGEVVLEVGDDSQPEALIAACARTLLRMTGLERCGYFQRDAASRSFRGRLGVPGTIDAAIRELSVGGRSDAVTAEIVRTSRPIFIGDARHDERLADPIVRAWNAGTLLGVPVLERDAVTGLFFLDGERPRAAGMDDAALERVLVFGELMGRWLTRSRRAAQLPSALRELEQERRAAQAIARVQPRLSELSRTRFNDGVVLRMLADQLEREVFLIGNSGELQRCEGPRGTPVVDARPDAPTITRLLHACSEVDIGEVRVINPSLDRGLRRRWVVAPVIAAQQRRGLVAVPEAVTAIHRLDIELVRRVADLLGLAAERAIDEQRLGTDHRHLRASDRLGIVPRSARTTSPGAAPALFIAFVLGGGEVARSSETTRELERLLVEHPGGRDGVILRTDAGLVVVLPATADPHPFELRIALAELLPAVGLRGVNVGIVHAAADEMDLAPALEEASRYAEWGREHPEAGPIVTAADLGPSRLFLTPHGRVVAMAREVLGVLLDDDPTMAELLATLRVYFAEGRSVRAASVRLGVHENTIRNRFGRTRQLIRRDVLGNIEDQLLVHAALLGLPPAAVLAPEAAEPDAAAEGAAS